MKNQQTSPTIKMNLYQYDNIMFKKNKFLHKGNTPSYTNWRYGEPNNKEKVEHFGLIEAVSQGRTWNDEEESATGIFALCQFLL